METPEDRAPLDATVQQPSFAKEKAVKINDDFRRGVMVTLGVLAALYVVGLATGVLKKLV